MVLIIYLVIIKPLTNVSSRVSNLWITLEVSSGAQQIFSSSQLISGPQSFWQKWGHLISGIQSFLASQVLKLV